MVCKQSAFSLIEVLITLVILSFGILGSGKLLVESAVGYRMAAEHAELLMVASAVVDSVSMDPEGVMTKDTLQYWQQKLQHTFPGSQLTIEQQILDNKCVYTIKLTFATPHQQTLTLRVVV